MADKTMSTILKVLYCLTVVGDVAVGLRDYLISIREYTTLQRLCYLSNYTSHHLLPSQPIVHALNKEKPIVNNDIL